MTFTENEIRRDAVWSFETARFFVGFYAEPEDMDPADQSEDQEDIADIRNGRVDYFCAAIRVYLKSDDAYGWEEIGSEYLGACAYRHASDFRNHIGVEARAHRIACAPAIVCTYFPGMVQEACRTARQSLARMGGVAVTLRAGAAV